MSPKARFQVFLEPDQLQALRKLQKATDAPVAALIRRAIAAYLEGKPDRPHPSRRKRP
jgi:hypothetical protein